MDPRDLGPILILDGDAAFRRAVRRVLAPIASVVEAESCAAATALVREDPSVRAFIVDVALPDGSGLDWLASARGARRGAPALVLTAICEAGLVNRALRLRATYACKPLPAKDLRAFVRKAIARTRRDEGADADPIKAAATRLNRAHKLTASEARIVETALRVGAARGELAAASGLNANTVKSQIRRVLRKVGAKSLVEVRDRVLRTAAAGEP